MGAVGCKFLSQLREEEENRKIEEGEKDGLYLRTERGRGAEEEEVGRGRGRLEVPTGATGRRRNQRKKASGRMKVEEEEEEGERTGREPCVWCCSGLLIAAGGC